MEPTLPMYFILLSSHNYFAHAPTHLTHLNTNIFHFSLKIQLVEPLPPPPNLPAYTFATQDQGGGFWNDQGLECVWACDVKPIRGPSNMGDVFVQAYRDTSVGPLPMNLGSHTVKADGVVEYPFLWSATDERRSKAIAEYPNPFLGCCMFIRALCFQ